MIRQLSTEELKILIDIFKHIGTLDTAILVILVTMAKTFLKSGKLFFLISGIGSLLASLIFSVMGLVYFAATFNPTPNIIWDAVMRIIMILAMIGCTGFFVLGIGSVIGYIIWGPIEVTQEKS
jgi:hypothetical protein